MILKGWCVVEKALPQYLISTLLVKKMLEMLKIHTVHKFESVSSKRRTEDRVRRVKEIFI